MNKLSYFIFGLFILLILMCSFTDLILDYIVLNLTYILSFIKIDVDVLNKIVLYVILAIIYISFGMLSNLMFADICSQKKNYYLYGILVPLFVIVLSMLIHSLVLKYVNYWKYCASAMFSILGFVIAWLRFRLGKTKN